MVDVKNLKMVSASDIIRNPEQDLEGNIRTIFDQSLAGLTWDNMEKALSILAEKGWRPVCMTALELSSTKAKLLYVIMSKTG